jgi:hypothetical protein
MDFRTNLDRAITPVDFDQTIPVSISQPSRAPFATLHLFPDGREPVFAGS